MQPTGQHHPDPGQHAGQEVRIWPTSSGSDSPAPYLRDHTAQRPTYAETQKTARRGQAEPVRDVLRRQVRTAAAGATTTSEFLERLRRGLRGAALSGDALGARFRGTAGQSVATMRPPPPSRYLCRLPRHRRRVTPTLPHPEAEVLAVDPGHRREYVGERYADQWLRENAKLGIRIGAAVCQRSLEPTGHGRYLSTSWAVGDGGVASIGGGARVATGTTPAPPGRSRSLSCPPTPA